MLSVDPKRWASTCRLRCPGIESLGESVAAKALRGLHFRPADWCLDHVSESPPPSPTSLELTGSGRADSSRRAGLHPPFLRIPRAGSRVSSVRAHAASRDASYRSATWTGMRIVLPPCSASALSPLANPQLLAPSFKPSVVVELPLGADQPQSLLEHRAGARGPGVVAGDRSTSRRLIRSASTRVSSPHPEAASRALRPV